MFGLAAISATVAASAATKQYNFSIGDSTLDWGQDILTGNDSSKLFSLARFDSSLGTLTGVKIHLDASLYGDVKLANLSNSSSNDITGTLSGNFILASNDNPSSPFTIFDETIGKSVSGTYAALSGGTALYDGIHGQDFGTVTASDGWSLSSSDAGILAYVSGSGSSIPGLNFKLSAYDYSYSTDTAGNAEFHYDALAKASGWIEYTYTAAPTNAVPAPPAMAAMISGLSVAMRRRKKASK